jgi:hypothetical protein
MGICCCEAPEAGGDVYAEDQRNSHEHTRQILELVTVPADGRIFLGRCEATKDGPR